MTDINNEIIRLVLESPRKDGKYNVIAPDTSFDKMEKEDSDSIEQTRNYLRENLEIEGYDITPLVDVFIEINRTSTRLTIPSDTANGYFIDYEYEYTPYLEPDGEGWEALEAKNPDIKSLVTISMPAYDPDGQMALVYFESLFPAFGATEGTGGVCAYKYEPGKLIMQDDVLVWMT